jgi:hypothetical protein
MRPQGARLSSSSDAFVRSNCFSVTSPFMWWPASVWIDAPSGRWKRAHRRQGRAGLRARPASGRPPKLSAAQRRRLARLVTSPGRKWPAIARACGRVDASST